MTLEDRLREVKLGKYSTLVPCYRQMAVNDAEELLKMSPEELKQFPGVGDKTARFFLMHAKEDANVATLDTHILKWMSKELGIEVPDGTPGSTEEYERLEKLFLKEANRRDRHPAHLDLEIWNQYSV
jgi:thermostable 8-oxoguanine DNA glycosylase